MGYIGQTGRQLGMLNERIQSGLITRFLEKVGKMRKDKLSIHLK